MFKVEACLSAPEGLAVPAAHVKTQDLISYLFVNSE